MSVKNKSNFILSGLKYYLVPLAFSVLSSVCFADAPSVQPSKKVVNTSKTVCGENCKNIYKVAFFVSVNANNNFDYDLKVSDMKKYLGERVAEKKIYHDIEVMSGNISRNKVMDDEKFTYSDGLIKAHVYVYEDKSVRGLLNIEMIMVAPKQVRLKRYVCNVNFEPTCINEKFKDISKVIMDYIFEPDLESVIQE